MRSVDIFFQSLREAFRPPERGSEPLVGVLVALVAVAIGVVLISRFRRRAAARASFQRFLAAKRISPAHAVLIDRIARQTRADPMSVATHVDVFERTTAAELAQHVRSPAAGETGVFAQVLQLRRALGFDELAEHFPLLTTRELHTGMRIDVAGIPATVTEVNEACFIVDIPLYAAPPLAKPGALLAVSLVHGQEARYAARCALFTLQTKRDARTLSLGHDEHPTRIQLRAAVRIGVGGAVELRPAPVSSTPASSVDLRADVLAAGTLQDVSVGGISIDTQTRVTVGSEVRASFEVDGVPCRDLPAWVLQCEPRSRSTYHLRLQFRDLSVSDESALAAAVARHTAKPFHRA